jgi:acetylornithine deacetylase/succinyl-diaminopimelate desuccinylase-like protein
MNKHPIKIDREGPIKITQNLIQAPSLSMQEKDAANLVAKQMQEIGFDEFALQHPAVRGIQPIFGGNTLCIRPLEAAGPRSLGFRQVFYPIREGKYRGAY